MVLAVLESPARVIAPPPPRSVRIVRLGSMWAERRDGDWRLLETLHPSWVRDEAEG
jgi:hypothetical protein